MTALLPVTPALHQTCWCNLTLHTTLGVTQRRVTPGQPGPHNNLDMEHYLKIHFSSFFRPNLWSTGIINECFPLEVFVVETGI